MLEVALLVIAGVGGLGLWYLAVEGNDNTIFRIFFMALGFLCFIVAFSQAGTLAGAYTVSNTLASTYYNQAQINSLANLNYTLMYAFIIGLVLYLAIEIILYLKNVLLMARQKKAKRYESTYEDEQ